MVGDHYMVQPKFTPSTRFISVVVEAVLLVVVVPRINPVLNQPGDSILLATGILKCQCGLLV